MKKLLRICVSAQDSPVSDPIKVLASTAADFVPAQLRSYETFQDFAKFSKSLHILRMKNS